MTQIEVVLLEAIQSLFQNNRSKLGIVPPRHTEVSHRIQFQYENIRDMFSLKAIDSEFHESLVSSFYNIHSYKFINDPTFPVALEKQMSAQGIPLEERKKALKYVREIIEEIGDERAAGWHPELDEITNITQNANNRDAKNTTPYTGGGPAPKIQKKISRLHEADMNKGGGGMSGNPNRLSPADWPYDEFHGWDDVAEHLVDSGVPAEVVGDEDESGQPITTGVEGDVGGKRWGLHGNTDGTVSVWTRQYGTVTYKTITDALGQIFDLATGGGGGVGPGGVPSNASPDPAT